MSLLQETCYLQLVPQPHWIDGRPPIGFSVKRVTQKRPDEPLPNAIVVKVHLAIDDEAFEQLPIAKVQIPLSAVQPAQVEVSAG